MEEEKKRQNLIVEGIKEDPDQHPKQQVLDMLSDIGAKVQADDVAAILRLGPGKLKRNRPRPILVKFVNVNSKYEVYRNVKNLSNSDKWKYIRIQDDLPFEVQQQRKEMRCLAALARERGHDATVKGNALIVDEMRYQYKDLEDLPEGINITNAKLVQLDDGWAFQSHHAFCSNMAQCVIQYKGHDFNSSEQVYWYKCAEEAEDQRTMERVRESKNGYEAKRAGMQMKKSQDLDDKKERIMEECQDLKYDQNDDLKDKLINLEGTLYEATMDMKFGAGLTIAQRDKFGSDDQKGQNKLGLMLMRRGTNTVNKVLL